MVEEVNVEICNKMMKYIAGDIIECVELYDNVPKEVIEKEKAITDVSDENDNANTVNLNVPKIVDYEYSAEDDIDKSEASQDSVISFSKKCCVERETEYLQGGIKVVSKAAWDCYSRGCGECAV